MGLFKASGDTEQVSPDKFEPIPSESLLTGTTKIDGQTAAELMAGAVPAAKAMTPEAPAVPEVPTPLAPSLPNDHPAPAETLASAPAAPARAGDMGTIDAAGM